MKPLAARTALHAGLWLATFVALASVLRRPYFAAVVVLGLQLLFLAVSRAKERVLREPLVFADLGLFSQAVSHPRLYVPYFGYWRATAAAAAFGSLIALGFRLEPAHGMSAMASLSLAALALALLACGTLVARSQLTLDAHRDAARFGLLGAMWLHALEARKSGSEPDLRDSWFSRPGNRALTPISRPHIVVVQSESFFDARRLYAGVAPRLLAHFDALAAQGESGRLRVPVWGAYTMRSELAFLSGMPNESLGVHRFNPYSRFALGGIPTIASWLRARGYRTACVHPYPASFFRRDRVFPALGFDAFVDAAEFAGARRAGPYVADDEVAAKLTELLREPGAPWFVFAITMENHGPLHLEKTSEADIANLYQSPPPRGFDELTVYLRHLTNADRMLHALSEELRRQGDGVLCLYGDHVPGMPEVYRALGYEDARTDYLVWRAGRPLGARVDRPVDSLALRVLETAGLAGAPA